MADDIAGVISESAGNEASPSPELSDELKNRLDQVDLLIADLGSLAQFKARASEYVLEAKIEATWNRRIRAATALGVFALVGILLTTVYITIFRIHWFLMWGSLNVLVGLAVSCIGGSVVLAIALTRSSFAPTTERNSGLPIPEHLSTLLEAVKSITSK